MLRSVASFAPDQAWLPFEPTREKPFDRRAAAHLYRRAGFGASSTKLEEAVRLGPQAAARRMFGGDVAVSAFDEEARNLAQIAIVAGDSRLLAAWWLHRMLHTPAPLIEKLTLFWHGHFATSAAKVRDAQLMLRQNELLRRNAAGDFGLLVREIARDPAMLLYLDSDTNRKNHPNENFAREVMELFCLGIEHYTERDIQELARCFTGREIQYGAFKFNADQHDEGRKTVLGKSGHFDGDGGLAIVLAHPASAEFICRKLVRFLVTDADELPASHIAPLARQFRDSGLRIGPVVETIITSRVFYSPASVAAKIRSPIELGMGLLAGLEATTNLRQLAGQLGDLGQWLFSPPSVKGWDGGRTWIDSSTLIGRVNLVRAVITSPQTRFGGGSLVEYLDRLHLRSGAELTDWLSEVLLAEPLSMDIRERLMAQLEEGQASRPLALAQLLHTIGSLPEFQLG